MIRSLRALIDAAQDKAQVVAELKALRPTEAISLSRWSRLKRAAADEQAARAEPVDAVALPQSGGDAVSAHAKIEMEANAEHAELVELPPLSAISLAEDFTPFMQAKVPQALKQQALKALFKEPHFNVMDGLDIYIDDYTVFEPIAPEVMATLSSWKTIMNPPKQVVTGGGYAVDVESEEGKAVLAARAELAALDPVELSNDATARPDSETKSDLLHPAVDESETDAAPNLLASNAADADAINTLQTATVIASIQHPRHNKRVGDFTYVDTLEIPPVSAEKTE